MKFSNEEFPANIPKEYKKYFEDLYELLNAITSVLSKIEDVKWRRNLAEMCILVLGFHELPEVRERLKGSDGTCYIL